MFATLKGKNSHNILHDIKDHQVGIFQELHTIGTL